MQRLVVVAQVYQLLNYGRVALEAPIRGNSIIPRLRYKEGSTIRAPENSIQGRVSFQPNQLTAVRFHVRESNARLPRPRQAPTGSARGSGDPTAAQT